MKCAASVDGAVSHQSLQSAVDGLVDLEGRWPHRPQSQSLGGSISLD
ncbi:MAG: hypothetical protein PF904_01000 [Kiritimatiellae bacterium]|jgi:hypothetical protein|nr:hypothetical protein [Kiritimatiellia bacterium]